MLNTMWVRAGCVALWVSLASAPGLAADEQQTRLIDTCFTQPKLRLPAASPFRLVGTTLVWDAKTASCLLRRSYTPRQRPASRTAHYLNLEQASVDSRRPYRSSCSSGWQSGNAEHPRLGGFLVCFKPLSKGAPGEILAVLQPRDPARAKRLDIHYAGPAASLRSLIASLEDD